jgi:CRISPR/Cas system-associated endonuclease Cas1
MEAATVADLRTIEGRVAQAFWRAYSKAMPQQFEFQGRMTTKHNNNASDSINSALNSGYGFLEQTNVLEILESAGNVTGVKTEKGEISASRVMNAANVWANQIRPGSIFR